MLITCQKNKMKAILKYFCYAAVLPVLVFSSCKSGEKIPDVSNIQVTIATQRLDKDLAAVDTSKVGEAMQQLNKKYPDFFNFYLDTLMGFKIMGNYADTSRGVQDFRGFLMHKDYRGLFDTVAKHYPDTKDVDEGLVRGFQFMKYYYADYKVPKVIYLVSGLANWGAFTLSGTTIGIGLDMFLGPQYPFYKSVGLPDYMYKHFSTNYIPVAVFSAVYQDQHPFMPDDKNLLDMIIQKGKEQYFVSKVLPTTPDSVRFAYTGSQLEWCKKNEAEIYNFFIKEELFYAKEQQKVLRYVMDGPSTTGMPPQSPGNIGTWLGWKIVTSYMTQHPKVTMQDMLHEKIDAQHFLEESGYKPR